MRRTCAFAIAVVAFLAVAFGRPAPAGAGGPTSVLITVPGSAATALYVTDNRYADLERMLTENAHAGSVPSTHEPGMQVYNVTWLIHDQLIWRTDRIHVDDRAVYTETTRYDGFEDDGGTTTWHRVADGDRLTRLLDGLLEAGPKVSAPATSAAAADPSVAGTPTAPGPERESAWFALTGWRWIVPGLSLGLLSGLLVPWRRGRTAREPRQVLVDRDPQRA